MLLLALGACSENSGDRQPKPSIAATRAPAPLTAEALAAQGVTRQYFDLLRARRFAEALALWTPDGATARGGGQAFATASRKIGSFDGKVGAPSEVRESGGVRFILVEASAQVTPPAGAREARHGVVMLKRTAAGSEPWRVWGVDIRKRRCKADQRPKGLGCVSP